MPDTQAQESGPLDNQTGLPLSPREFERLVGQALDAIPQSLADLVVNLAVLVVDEPPADDPELLGLYDGVPLTERGLGGATGLPDQILIFRGPLTRMCADVDELRREITITVVHEVAHHFGINDDRLHELGYG